MRTITTTVRTGMRIMSIPSPPSRLPRRVFRRIWRITRWPLAVLVVLVTSLFAINAFDDRLTPLAQEMLRSPDNPFRDDQNLYVLLAGLDAPAGESVLERGQRNIREFSAAYSSKPVGTSVHPGTGRTPEEKALRIERGVLTGNPLAMSVWDWARDDAANIGGLATRHQELLARYEALQMSAGYHEMLPPVAEVPVYAPPQGLRQLYLGELARRVRGGNKAERTRALQSLVVDLDLWQRMLHGAGTLMSKMLAVAYLQADLLLLSDVIADSSVPLDLPEPVAKTWLQPLPVDAWKIGKVFAAELRFQAEALNPIANNTEYFLKLPADSPTFWERARGRIAGWFYLHNATMNLQAARMHEIRMLSYADPATLRTRIDALDERLESVSYSFPVTLRNPVGKILSRIAAPTYTEYPLRVYDTAAIQRALALAYRIREQRIELSDVPAFMTAHHEWSTHPVGNVQFAWDARKLEIRIPQQARARPERRHSVRVPRINPDKADLD
jgi:hypothetical protein